jgi:hypothetical protein
MDEYIRTSLLIPLRHAQEMDLEIIHQASNRLDELILGNEALQLSSFRNILNEVSSGGWADLDRVRKYILVVNLLYTARNINKQECIFYIDSSVERINNKRLDSKEYEPELEPISNQIDKLKTAHGLDSEEDWPIDQSPLDYQLLNAQFEEVLNKKIVEILRELNLYDLAALKEADPNEYETLRERGRRSLYHKDNYAEIVEDIIIRYEEEAQKSAAA